MSKYKYDNPDDAYKEALRRIDLAINEAKTKLDLYELGLTTIPLEIFQLTELTELNLYKNKLTTISPEIFQLKGLTKLWVNENQISTIPSEIGQSTRLTHLYLHDNQLTYIPSEIGQLTKLVTLYLDENKLSTVPREIERLTRLVKLRLFNNQLTTVPTEIGQLARLTYFDLNENQLTAIPPRIGQLTELEVFNLGGNQLTVIPPEIGQLTKLTELKINNNQLTTIPPEIKQLTKLTYLDLEKNQLTAVPPEIGQLTELRGLDLSENQLTIIPPEITQLINLEYLDLHYNPDLPIPPEITSQIHNPQAILDYIRELNITPAENMPLNEAKVILVGRGEAGKTSLVKRLVHNSFDPNEKQTDGVNVTPWELSVDRPAQGIVPIALNIWDFGGQEILHATHKFFLTERSLYLIVVEPRQDDYRQQVEYWLSLIHDVAAGSPIIVVINKIDTQRIDVDRRGLQKKYPNIIHAFARTSAATGEGMTDLTAVITTALANMDEVDTPFPPSWMRIKQTLTTMKSHRPHMPYHAYEQLCIKEGVTDKSSQRSLIGFLHRLGIVLNFQDDGRVRHTNVLDPNWISNGVYNILTNSLPQTQKGALHRNQLPHILPAAYEDQHDYVLDMMLKFELAYTLTNDSVLIPDLIAEEEPDYVWDDVAALQFEYQYEVLRRSTLHRLMVRRHRLINSAAVWRTGVMLQRDGLSALIRADIEAKTIRISINGKGNDGSYGPRQFLYDLRSEFTDIHDSIRGTKPKDVVPIPAHPTAAPIGYTYLMQLEKSNLQTVPHPDKNGKVLMLDVEKLLNGISTSAMRTREQQVDAERRGRGDTITYNIYGDNIQGNKANRDIIGGDSTEIGSITDSTVDIG